MAKRDYYDVLGVERGAGADDMKKSFRKLAMQHHPDRNPGDAAAEHNFKELNEAYDVLKDDQKRAAYDRFGHAAFENGGGGPGAGAHGFDFNASSGFADIFDEMFGDFMGKRSGRARGPARGADLRYNMEITLEDAFAGKQTQIRVPTSVRCDDCGGSGAAKGSKPVSCPSCQGHGKVRTQQGFFTVERTCPNCHGGGRIIEDPCPSCSGAGRVRKEKTLAVTIPEGVEEGTRIRLSGEGEAGVHGAPSGDLYIFLSVAAHPIFQREAASIYCRVPIPMTTAALGGTVEVPTIEGTRARLTIPAGTQTGRQFRLRGKGMTILRSRGRGDMYLEVAVETPVNLGKKQKDLLKELESSGGTMVSPESEGFFAKAKELWEDLKD
jgi:molecular chaperone DnaJ